MLLAMIIGGATGMALFVLIRSIAPGRVDLAAAVGRWDATAANAVTAPSGSAVAGGQAAVWKQRLGASAARWVGRQGWNLTRKRQELAITGKTMDAFLVEKILCGAIGLVLPSIFAGILVAGAVPVPPVAIAAAGIPLGVMLFFLPDLDLQSKAEEKRTALRRALGSYLVLVSLAMSGGKGVPEALPSAARVGQGWGFQLIAETISHARYTGSTPWQAFAELGQRFGMQEFTDLGSALGLVADDGAKVRESLAARAVTMRRREKAETEGEAQRADEQVRVAHIFLAMGFIALVLYPAMINVLGF